MTGWAWKCLAQKWGSEYIRAHANSATRQRCDASSEQRTNRRTQFCSCAAVVCYILLPDDFRTFPMPVRSVVPPLLLRFAALYRLRYFFNHMHSHWIQNSQWTTRIHLISVLCASNKTIAELNRTKQKSKGAFFIYFIIINYCYAALPSAVAAAAHSIAHCLWLCHVLWTPVHCKTAGKHCCYVNRPIKH